LYNFAVNRGFATIISGSAKDIIPLDSTTLILDILGGALQVNPWRILANNKIVIVVPSMTPGQPRLPVLKDMNLKCGSVKVIFDPSFLR
jgi:hypothetical protein